VLARGIVFIDLAIAQVAALGVVAADVAGWPISGWHAQAAACIAALTAAALLTWIERHWPDILEALIGVLFVTAASTELLLLAHDPHGGEHLKDLLVGQILWVTPGDLVPAAALYAGVLALWFGAGERLGRIGFYGLFALTVTASVQLVGIYLVFASLIVPAIMVRRLPPARALGIAYLGGAVAYGAGLVLSALSDLPTGPTVVCALVVTGLALPTIRLALTRGPVHPTCKGRNGM